MTTTTTKAVNLKHGLDQRRFFKLIIGASFTEAHVAAQLTAIYAEAGAHCIDIACDPEVLCGVAQALNEIPADQEKPLLMVSVALDGDPHFQKISLEEAACTACGLCLPVCPVEALSLNHYRLNIDQPLCYGCTRCVPICPTAALSMNPLPVEAMMPEVLQHDMVQAVELHTRYAEPVRLAHFLAQYRDLLQDKILSFCFRANEIDPLLWMASIKQLLAFNAENASAFPLIIQADGAPMSGNADPEGSLPALENARLIMETLEQQYPTWPEQLYITVSGGINAYTGALRQRLAFQDIAGVGVGTIARKHVWESLQQHDRAKAVDLAKKLISQV